MSDKHFPRTKIVCTIGPASSDPAVLKDLIDAGLDVARVNFSHGDHARHAGIIAAVREAAALSKKPVGILGDLQGPRIRVGVLTEPLELKEGSDVTLVGGSEAAAGEIPITYERLADDVKEGDRILMDDGLLEVMALEVRSPRIRARVVHGGSLRSNKGLNLPGVRVSAPSLTEKDREDITFAVAQGVDFLALSFVRRPEDILELRQLVPREVLIIAKIEKDVALRNIEAILREADGVMVARGDLGVELPFEEVPLAQKRIIALANRLGRPVITATQMLESMVEHARPTRAEASDVANAIIDGTDAVMLSAETATGAFPRLAVAAMARIIREVESHPIAPLPDFIRLNPPDAAGVRTEVAIAAATVAAARMINAPCVVVFTKSGFSARVIASHRPHVPVVVLTDVERTFRQMALVWGVVPVLVPHCDMYSEMVEHAVAAVARIGLAQPGARIIVTAGVPFDVPGTTNMMKVETV